MIPPSPELAVSVSMPSPRALRLRLAWLLAFPFLLLATPTSTHLIAGLILALPGLALRVLASGYIDKDRSLAVAGPYRYLRHPLYLGSFLAGLGLAVGSGRGVLLAGFLGAFAFMYGRAIRVEEMDMEVRFGKAWREYRRRVPALVPWPRASGTAGVRTDCPDLETPVPPVGPLRFQRRVFSRNRPWDGVGGVLCGFLLLWIKMYLFR